MGLPLIAKMAERRRVIAFDTPGNGDSDPLPIERPELADFAAAAWEAIDSLHIEQFDLYGTHFGTRLATEMALQQPDRTRRIIFDGEGLPDEAFLADLLENIAPDFVPDARCNA